MSETRNNNRAAAAAASSLVSHWVSYSPKTSSVEESTVSRFNSVESVLLLVVLLYSVLWERSKCARENQILGNEQRRQRHYFNNHIAQTLVKV